MAEYQELWDKVLEKLEEHYNEETYEEVFSHVKEVKKVINNVLYILVPSDFVKSRINKIYIYRINEILNSLSNEQLSVKFVTEEELPQEKSFTTPEKLDASYRPGNIIKRYDFSNFVVGKSNMFAFRMAMKIADQPGLVANPLYIFGNVGLGKTHLMQAIGNYIFDNDISKKILYVKADEFIEDYIKFSSNKMPDFKDKYRSIDVFLVDDIQMLGIGKKSQIEFFNLFDYLYNQNKQIVITSDRPASELTEIMERLTSRFQVGLTVDISAPNADHRVQILRKKLSEQTDEEVNDDVLNYIASIFTANVRELEGALSRVINYCSFYNVPINLENTMEAIEPLVNTRKISASYDENNYDKIQSVVADYYHISVTDLIGNKRTATIVLARHIAMYLIKNKYDIPYKKIGALFGGRDHSSVLSAVDKIETEIKTNEVLNKAVSEISKKIG